MSITRIKPGPRMSKAVIHGNTVYLAGNVANDFSGDVAEQTRQTLANIDSTLAEAGTDKSNLLSAQVWVTHMSSFAEMNEVWDAWVSPGNTPARACVEARLARPSILVEIMVIAAIP
jgi:enamine deaminase RidA (YjgF/YER057c/UK114 family)